MSFARSLSAGISGVRNHQLMMDIIGNNIANINTIGYKGSRITFSESFAQMLRHSNQPFVGTGGTNPIQVGLGMSVNSVDTLFSQGTVEMTGEATDLAIHGRGMFVVEKDGQLVYTRAGNFTFDSSGMLVHPGSGAILQGILAREDGTVPTGTALENIRIDLDRKSPANATGLVKLAGNLNASGKAANITNNVFFEGNLNEEGGADKVLLQSIYDATGKEYILKMVFSWNDGPDQWEYSGDVFEVGEVGDVGEGLLDTPINGDFAGGVVTDDSFEFLGETVNLVFTPNSHPYDGITIEEGPSTVTIPEQDGNAAEKASSSFTIFDSLGNPHTLSITFTKMGDNQWMWLAEVMDPDDPDNPLFTWGGGTGDLIEFDSKGTISHPENLDLLGWTPPGGADEMSMTISLGTSGSFSGLTQSEGSSDVIAREQDGYRAGFLTDISVDQNGRIQGTFSNGRILTLGQIMLAEFSNPGALTRLGNNLYGISGNSGIPAIISPASESQAGSIIVSGALEQANVDLTQEFARMIVAQRGFQASARVITASDEILSEVVNLKR